MYISFDWSRQRYKRQEYIDVYIALKLDKIPPEKVWPFEEEDGREEMLLQIEDELPLEQILLYRSIARSIRVKGVTKMPATVHELHKNRTLRVRGLKTRRSSVRTPGIIPRDTGETTFLSLLQNKFDMSRRVRLDGGMTERFQNPGQLKKKRHQAETDQDLDVLSSEAAQNPARKASIGFDSAAQSDSGRKTPRKMAISSSGRKASLGFDSVSDIKPGNFYTTGNRRDSVADGRTIKTSKKESRHTRSTMAGETVGQVSDGRMRINFSLQVKCIDLMIIQEDYFFEMSPEMQGGNKGGRMSPDARSRDYDDDDEDSSSDDDLSDLSVLTDDERFFNDPNQIGAPVEEESENGGAKLSSTDFLSFGLPENLLLRLTISSLGTYIRGKGGGPMHLAVSVGRINAVADGDCRILSIGLSQPGTPIAEVNVETPGHKRSRSNDSMDFDFSSHRGPYQRQDEFSTPGRLRQNAPSRAVSLLLCIEDGSKSVQCDFSKIGLNVDLDPAVKLLKFVESSKIVYPNKILAKSSRDVARKFMVYKTSNSSKLRSLSTAIRVHGLEISVPFTLNDASASEASSLDSRRSDYMLGNEATRVNPKNCTAVLVAETVEVYSGDAVDEIVAGSAIDLGQSPSSLWSSIFASKRSTAKTMEMLDIVELTSSHDSFACTHWVRKKMANQCVLRLCMHLILL